MVKWSNDQYQSYGQKKTRLLALTRALRVTLSVCLQGVPKKRCTMAITP